MPDNTSSSNTQSGGGTPPGNTQGKQPPAAVDFDEWLVEQPDHIKTMLADHTKGLKGALDTERKGRKDLEKQLREAAGKLEQGSDARKTLEDQAARLAAAERQTAFYDAAQEAGVVKLRLAYLAAVDGELIDDKGRVDWTELRKHYPELFAAKTQPAGNAGAGTQGAPPASGGMNDYIRRAAGRQ